ncbi:hypothetical protein KY289_027003 [Solanum tuberosum]|nr:hypothetical protein KY289_027003 [Solanum tuberosum]
MTHRPQTYNWYVYKSAWMNFLYLRPRQTWFMKYSPSITKSTIPRWFYEWWNLFGGIEKILPQQFLNRFDNFQAKEDITTLPEHIKLCKYYIKKRISYIITWDFSNNDIERIQYLCKQIQVKGWIPKQPNKYDEKQIMKMIEDVASTEGSSEDNGDMCNPKGFALAYMDPDYE